jgi:hypothetical protein
MVSLVVAHMRAELRWLRRVAGEIARRAPAQNKPE